MDVENDQILNVNPTGKLYPKPVLWADLTLFHIYVKKMIVELVKHFLTRAEDALALQKANKN